MTDKVKIVNHGQTTHVIGGVDFHPGQVEMPREVWKDLRGIQSLETLLDDSQLEVRENQHGSSKDEKKRKDIDLVKDLERHDFAQERIDKSMFNNQYRDTQWLEDQIEAYQASGEVDSRRGAIENIAGLFGVTTQTIKKYTR